MARRGEAQGKGRKFIVACDEYGGFSGGGPLTVDLYEAGDLDDLILNVLQEAVRPEDWDDDDGKYPCPSPTKYLQDANGDGMNFYIIKELLPDGTLGPELIGPNAD